MPRAVTAHEQLRAETLRRLRASIQSIEDRGGGRYAAGHGLSGGLSGGALAVRDGAGERWCLGAAEIDRRLGLQGLDPAGLHEIKPMRAGETGRDALAGRVAGALAFAWRLAARRMLMGAAPEREDDARATFAGRPARLPVLWCASVAMANEYGCLYGPGLAPLGCHHTQVVAVITQRHADTLWAIEEALRSGAVGAVIAHVETVDLTPARRLALAAQDGATPCLIVSGAAAPEIPATATRWRVGPAPSVAPFASQTSCVPTARASVGLERSRRSVTAGALTPRILEWSDETSAFRVVPGLADGAARPRAIGAG